MKLRNIFNPCRPASSKSSKTERNADGKNAGGDKQNLNTSTDSSSPPPVQRQSSLLTVPPDTVVFQAEDDTSQSNSIGSPTNEVLTTVATVESEPTLTVPAELAPATRRVIEKFRPARASYVKKASDNDNANSADVGDATTSQHLRESTDWDWIEDEPATQLNSVQPRPQSSNVSNESSTQNGGGAALRPKHIPAIKLLDEDVEDVLTTPDLNPREEPEVSNNLTEGRIMQPSSKPPRRQSSQKSLTSNGGGGGGGTRPGGPKRIPSIRLWDDDMDDTNSLQDPTLLNLMEGSETTTTLKNSITPRRRSSHGPKRTPSVRMWDLEDLEEGEETQILIDDGFSMMMSSEKRRHSRRRRSSKLCNSMSSVMTASSVVSRVSVASTRASRTTETNAASSGKCPFRHGTVYTDPYPGYVHGNPKRGICPNGCRPEMTADITDAESPRETLIREATEFISLYYHEREDQMGGKDGFLTKAERMDEIKRSIEETGTYEHTFDELQHGAQVAWRNAPKCANRKYWQQLKLLDCRKVTTNKGMFDCCMEHLTKAMSCGSSEAYITVFKPAPPGKTMDGPRVWNDQLLQYAAYNMGREIIGDPKNLRFTEMLKERFEWDGPRDGKKGQYDYLPLIIQANSKEPPELFEVPQSCAPPVYIHHPRYPELSSLNMQWYPIPAVSALDMTVGGLVYTAVPFNGWYANTEVVRDFADEGRYNMLVPVAKVLGLDPNTKPGEAAFWKDEVMNVLSMAVYHSFKTAKVAMIDHHSLIDMFWLWYHDELNHRKYCPVNWKWVIPPMSPSTNKAYLGLNRAQEYTLKPAYLFGASPFQLEVRYFGRRDTSKAMEKFVRAVHLAILFKRMINRMRERKEPILIIYASVTGNAAKYASDLGAILRSCSNISFFDACGVNAAADEEVFSLIRSATLTIFISSTQGNGELPSLSHKFFSSLFEKNGSVLRGENCAVLGFGSSAYPIFCGAAIHISDMLLDNGAVEVVPRGECDAVLGESPTFYKWTKLLVLTMARMPSASPLVFKLLVDLEENTTQSLVRARDMLDSIQVEVFSTEEVQNAAALSYLTARKGLKGTIARRRTVEEGDRPDEEWLSKNSRLMGIIGKSDHDTNENLEGKVISREDVISSVANGQESDVVARTTSLVKLDLQNCGNPPYQPGDHIRVFPRNVICLDKLEVFISHLSSNWDSRDLSLDDQIYVSCTDEDIPRSELAVSLPLLSESLDHLFPLDYFFETQVAIEAPISMQACLGLACIATGGKDRAVLQGIGQSKKEYENMVSLCGMKWIDLFKIFPSLSKQVCIKFLLCNMKVNHPRSYSIASCKSVVGSELHMVVGRFIYSRGGSKKEAGVCSSFLTSVEPGDEVMFKMESAPSFHHPLDPSCPIIFICTGTGYAPIRGLLQKRSYYRSRGEKLGQAFLIFGSRSSKEGLFHDEINSFKSQGVLKDVFMCYSREPGEPKEYTADKIQSKRTSIVLRLILGRPNTHVFICGSANMAEASKDALRKLSPRGFGAVARDGRLHCDVFGALSTQTTKAKRERMSLNLLDMSDSEGELSISDNLDFGDFGGSREIVRGLGTWRSVRAHARRPKLLDRSASMRNLPSGPRSTSMINLPSDSLLLMELLRDED